MKKLVKLLLITMLCAFSMAAYAADKDAVLKALDGAWYNADGTYAFEISAANSAIEEGKIVDIKHAISDDTVYTEATWVIEQDGKDAEIRTAVDRVGETTLLSFLGEYTFQNTEKIAYPDSVEGIYIGMSREMVKAKLGDPSNSTMATPVVIEGDGVSYESIARLIRDEYKDKKIEVDYLYDRVFGIYVEAGSEAKLDKSGLGVASAPEEFVKAYNVNTGDARYMVQSNGTILPIDDDQFIWVGKTEKGNDALYLSRHAAD